MYKQQIIKALRYSRQICVMTLAQSIMKINNNIKFQHCIDLQNIKTTAIIISSFIYTCISSVLSPRISVSEEKIIQ